ncbi:MAG TPA: ComEC/Rec2 family competence protein, partial [Gemmataceae bacterium]
PEQAGVAAALLLGDATAMSGPEWDRYARAGVVHALAISGQHLVVLGWFAWFVLRLTGLRRRQAAAAVALFLLAYALLTGGRPAAMRAAVMVGVFCGGVLLVRPVLPANALACAWLAVLMLNPTDPFTPGCQLSFAATAVLMAAASWFRRPELSPVEELTEESRPAWLRAVRELGRMTLVLYAVNLILWLAATPLIAHWNHVVSPVAVLVGPPVVLLSSLALVAGFLLLLALPLGGWLAAPFAWLTGTLLEMCQGLVGWANAAPGGCLFLAGPGLWWLAGFYAGLAALLLLAGTGLPVRRWALTGGAAWLGVGLLAGIARPVADELRVTFLAVGHGGCTVLETPDGRVLLYDAGAITGPEVTRRRIAPFLWHRGVGRIDEVFLSHADLDHFNGLPDLLERFPVGQITLAGGFTARDSPGVELLLRRADELGVPVRTAVAGDRFAAGEVTLEVLHPPREGMEGDENVRSLVLRVTHAGHTILLTGDLEGPGLARVLNLPPGATDVLMAPHHGSRRSNTPELADTTRPRLVVSSQAAPLWPPRQPSPYEERRIPVLATHEHGAVTLLSHRGGLVVETFRGNQRWAVRPEGAP